MAYLKIRVTPGARQDALAGWQGDVLRLRVRAAPERGGANEAVCRLLARSLRVPPGHVTLARGAASRDKLVYIDGLSEEKPPGSHLDQLANQPLHVQPPSTTGIAAD